MEGEVITSQELFSFKQEGYSPEGKIVGHHHSCNIMPTFVEEIQVSNLPFDLSIFNEDD